MVAESTNILIIEGNQDDALFVNELLLESGFKPPNIFIENTLKNGLKKLECENINLILLDLGFQDSDSENTIGLIQRQTTEIPIIILAESDNQKTVTEFVKQGVQDSLIKGKFDSCMLLHSIQYALLRFEHKKKIRELSDFKSKLFRIVSHDLKGPMGALYSYIEMMLEDIDQSSKQRLREDLTSLEEISKSLLNLIENLFNWARIQIGSIEINPEIIELKEIVRENIRICKLQIENKNITIINNVPNKLRAYADLEMTKTVIRNLLFNAIKFTNNNGVIGIDGKLNGNISELIVSDNGIGIDDNNIREIFNKCNNFSTNGTNHEKGSGLGLTLCKEFIELNNGNIWVNSKVGEGSSFSFSLPNVNLKFGEEKLVSLDSRLN